MTIQSLKSLCYEKIAHSKQLYKHFLENETSTILNSLKRKHVPENALSSNSFLPKKKISRKSESSHFDTNISDSENHVENLNKVNL